MAINLATKNSDRIASYFTKSSFVKGKTSEEYDFTGSKTLKIYTPVTVPENDYVRSGMNRYGEPTEMQDIVQELVMSQDKAFTLTIDKGNNRDQMNVKGAAKMLKLQLNEQSIPAADRYAFSQFVCHAGTVKGLDKAPTKDTIIGLIADAVAELDNNLVDEEHRYIAVTGDVFKLIKLSPEFVGVETLGKKSIGKGIVGEVQGLKVVKVPNTYLPKDCYFLIWVPAAVMFPYKISDAKYHKDPPGLSGDLLEGRHYYDAFVLGAKSAGVYAAVLGASQQAAPSVSYATDKLTVTAEGATEIRVRRLRAGGEIGRRLRRGARRLTAGGAERLLCDRQAHRDGGGRDRDPGHPGRQRPALQRLGGDLLHPDRDDRARQRQPSRQSGRLQGRRLYLERDRLHVHKVVGSGAGPLPAPSSPGRRSMYDSG